jgi:hypothetical protein
VGVTVLEACCSGPAKRAKRTAPRETNRVLTDTEIVTSRSFQGTRYQHLVVAVGCAIDEADPIRLLEIGAPGDEYAAENRHNPSASSNGCTPR